MSRALSRRQYAAIVLSLAALLALPFHTALAVPRGTQVSAEIVPLLAVVSAGETAAFDATITNAGSATITNLRFDGWLSNGAALISTSSPCAAEGPQVGCALPNLVAGASHTIRFLVTSPEDAGGLDLVGAFSAEGRRSNPGGSRDTWPAAAALEVSDSADLLSRWQQAHGNITLPTVGDSDEQVTAVSVPPVGFDYPALVQHGDDEIVCDGTPIEGVGRTVTVSIAGGGSPVELTIAYDKDELNGTTPGRISVVHQLDDGTCEFPPRDCSDNAGFCYDARWSGSGAHKKLLLHVELPSNGSIKGI